MPDYDKFLSLTGRQLHESAIRRMGTVVALEGAAEHEQHGGEIEQRRQPVAVDLTQLPQTPPFAMAVHNASHQAITSVRAGTTFHLNAIVGEQDDTLRQVLLDSWAAEPASVGSAEWDALLAAVVAHELESAGLDAPTWSIRSSLPTPWTPEHPFLTPDRVRAQTPDWLSRRNIYVPARDLVTA